MFSSSSANFTYCGTPNQIPTRSGYAIPSMMLGRDGGVHSWDVLMSESTSLYMYVIACVRKRFLHTRDTAISGWGRTPRAHARRGRELYYTQAHVLAGWLLVPGPGSPRPAPPPAEIGVWAVARGGYAASTPNWLLAAGRGHHRSVRRSAGGAAAGHVWAAACMAVRERARTFFLHRGTVLYE